MATQSVASGGMLDRVFKPLRGNKSNTFQKTSIEDFTEEDVECVRSAQNERETNHPFEDGDFMALLKRGGKKLNALKDEGRSDGESEGRSNE
jgi:hypothetical protein